MRGKIKYLILSLVVILGGILPPRKAEAESCPELKIVFARGSGGERWKDQNYLAFKTSIEEKLKTVSLNFEFIDLDYPAVGVGTDNLEVTLGAYFGGGDNYEFGRSVDTGVDNLVKMINETCPESKYVIGGYSQGAMVISKALSKLNPERIIYAATFGDPKIYLPEGKGLVPTACSGKGLSDYRMYVPDCQAYKGLLGAYIPYRPDSLIGKVGTWCNKKDIFCSSKFSIDDHVSYVSENLYADASKTIFDKIAKYYGLENHISSPHDTVIMLDSTASMTDMIDDYKAEALRLATLTLESGGRVALYDYRDLEDPYYPIEHCNFETCTIDVIKQKLDTISVDGGGDDEESLLSASFSAMKSLRWKFGATKSIVVLTDAPFLLPDRDGVTLEEVVRLSKEIDPVNFYIITNEESADSFNELVEKTDGKIVTNFNELNLLTDYIMERYDSLPRVEERSLETFEEELPTIDISDVIEISDSEILVRFSSSSGRAMIILNDEVLGTTNLNEITIGNIRNDVENVITIIPITDELRGEGVSVTISHKNSFLVPKAPDTGRL